MASDLFPTIILIGRAGSGKSEFIDFLKHLDEPARLAKFHIGAFEEVDDFPILFELFQDEDLWERLGRPRKLARRRESIYVTEDYDVYPFCLLKLSRIAAKRLESFAEKGLRKTLFIEFARGREDGYRKSFDLLDPKILERAAVVYIDNTFEESMRRNTVRSSDSDSRQTILHHKTPVEIMEYFYKTHDWKELSGGKADGYLDAQGLRIPFVTIWNMPETHDFGELSHRYGPPLTRLWELHAKR